MLRRRALVPALAAAAVAAIVASATAGAHPLRFRVLAKTGIKLTDVLWDGTRLVYVENTENVLYTAPPNGKPLTKLASMPKLTEETRCVPSPGSHGFPAGLLYCHSPDNEIYAIGADGKASVFATIPEGGTADGALAFDDVGSFGYRLVAATGRSGNPKPAGGTVWAIGAAGKVDKVGSYGGPGGADEVVVAPKGFGSAGGEALLTVDAGHSGAVVAMDARGRTRTLARLSDGPNPIVVIPARPTTGGAAAPGFYVGDTGSTNVYFLPGSQLAPYAGDVLVGSELLARFWVLAPHGKDYAARRLPTNLRGGKYNLEGGAYVG